VWFCINKGARQNLVPLSWGGGEDKQNGGEKSRPTAWEQNDGVAIW